MKRRAVANYLKRARLAAGFETQAAFATATDLSQQQISNYERSGRVPQENIGRIARTLNIPADELAMLLVEAAEEDERASNREAAELRRQHEAALVEIRQIVEINRDINEQIGKDIAEIKDLLSRLPEVLQMVVAALRESPGR